MRVVGLDVSRTFAEIAYLEDGCNRADGRVEVSRAALAHFSASLRRKHRLPSGVLEVCEYRTPSHVIRPPKKRVPRFRDLTISTEVPYCAMSEW